MPRRTKSVSEKNTKSEILAAYQQLLDEAASGSAVPAEAAEDRAAVTAASSETVEKIATELSKLKLSFVQAVNDLTDRLTGEAERLAAIRKAIALSKKELEETQKIKTTAGLLYRMLELQKTKEKAWAEEEKAHEEEMNKRRSRDSEEYAYEMKLQKQRDADERESARLNRERKDREGAEAEAAMRKELEELRKKVAQAPAETDKAVKNAVSQALEEAKKETEVVLAQTRMQAASDQRIAELKVESLETANKTQANEIIQLKKQLDEVTRQVKDIAVSVIENARKEPAAPGQPGS